MVPRMGLAETIASVGGKAAIEQIAKRFGLPEAMAGQAVGMLLPALSNGLSRNASSEGGLGSLLGAIAGGNHERYLEDPASLAESATTSDGNGILGHLLGNKDASRAVAATVSGFLGIESDTVKKMLPVVAAMAMGGLAKQTKKAGLHESSSQSGGDILGQLTGMLGVGGASDILGKLLG